MVFSSFTFLFLFLPAFFAVYSVFPRSQKNTVALLFSYLFYAWGAPAVIPWLLLSSTIDYSLSHQFSHPTRRRPCLVLGITLNVGLLAYYKYAHFLIAESNRLLSLLGLEAIPFAEVALPIGISFFTFQKMSYLVDVYRGETSPAKNLRDYLLYVVLFPQLIAGPIIRYHDVAEQLRERLHSLDRVHSGVLRFCLGLAKKVLIADEMGRIADNAFSFPASELTPAFAWVGILAYAFQIYFDFSGYSDMAIGLGRMMGFEFLENFNMPYISQSITEFWRRWHMSLSRWMKEYLYIPLGGNRVSAVRTYINLWAVFFFSGLWHGASWTFVFWGLYHGLFLVLDRVFWLRLSSRLPRGVNIVLTFFIVLISWVFFRADSFELGWMYLSSMFGANPELRAAPTYYWAQLIHTRGIVVLTIAALLSFLPAIPGLLPALKSFWEARSSFVRKNVAFTGAFAGLVLSVLSLSANEFSPFLYFRF